VTFRQASLTGLPRKVYIRGNWEGMMSRPIFAIVPLAMAAICFAQRTTEVSGRITDASQAVIANAAVTITNVDTRVERATVSNELGYYAVPLLSPGEYQITVLHEGFRPITRSG
jgi:hypothetical protein